MITKKLALVDISSYLPNTLTFRGVFSGDADDAAVGSYIVRPESVTSHLPLSREGYLECVGGQPFKRQIFMTNFQSPSQRMFVRNRWYNNTWSAWREFQLLGGGNSLAFNKLRKHTERRWVA